MSPARGRASPAPGWEVPYIPPGGVVEECLLPDGCDSCDDPVMSLPLRPLGDFDHPLLKQARGADLEWDPMWSLNHFMAKNCAGMSYELRVRPESLMRAFRTGTFSPAEARALSWAFSGMRRKYMFPSLVASAQLPIFEVARCFWKAFDGYAYGCAPWLNQWADNPQKPHPCARPRTFPKDPSPPRYNPDMAYFRPRRPG